jgi:hypothetical protein
MLFSQQPHFQGGTLKKARDLVFSQRQLIGDLEKYLPLHHPNFLGRVTQQHGQSYDLLGSEITKCISDIAEVSVLLNTV